MPGVRADSRKSSHFAMDLIKKETLGQKFSKLKRQKLSGFASASKPVSHLSVMVHTMVYKKHLTTIHMAVLIERMAISFF